MSSAVNQEVQAALLNSESEPKEEVQRALEAVAEFAFLECSMGQSEFERRAKLAYQTALKARL